MTEEKESIFLELAPKFIWVIRDFTLNKTLPGTDIEIDNNQYLDISLRKKVIITVPNINLFAYTKFLIRFLGKIPQTIT